MIVVARGGGSVEDLLPFSDEGLVRAVHAVTTPLVSAIGHEPDSPILDLVADVRASTPTDAAKRVVPDVAEEAQRVLQARERGRMAIRGLVDRELAQLAALRSRPSLADPRSGLAERMVEVDAYRERARRSFGHRLDRGSDDLVHQLARIRALSPLATLRRGYAVLSDADGQALSSVATLEPGQDIHIRVGDGRIGATTTSVRPDRPGQRPPRQRRPATTQTTTQTTPRSREQRGRPVTDELSYEDARDQLIEVVRTLEQGGTSLAESLALWERGEELAKVCQRSLEGARARLDEALGDEEQ